MGDIETVATAIRQAVEENYAPERVAMLAIHALRQAGALMPDEAESIGQDIDRDNAHIEKQADRIRTLEDALRVALDSTWEHRCSDGVGGCTAISAGKYENARRALEGE